MAGSGRMILITGANGFIGSALCLRLKEVGYCVRKAIRDRTKLPEGDPARHTDHEWVVLHDRSAEVDTQRALDGVQTVVHLAARVHVMKDLAADPLREFREVNRDWTERLARVAAEQGVRRFVYLSSVKVNGEQSSRPFTEQDSPNPNDPYGMSKWEAEQALATVADELGLETVVIRSPLVYGAGVGGNLLQLLDIIHKGIPLPLASAENRRSLIYRQNLVDLLVTCIHKKAAAGQTYLVSDGEDLSTPEFIRRLAKALGLPARLWPLPRFLLRGLSRIVGKPAVMDRLLGSLQVDSSKIRRELNWDPPFPVDQGFAEMAAWFRARTSCQGLTS